MASTSQDSSFGDESTQDQDPLAIEPKVSRYSLNEAFELITYTKYKMTDNFTA